MFEPNPDTIIETYQFPFFGKGTVSVEIRKNDRKRSVHCVEPWVTDYYVTRNGETFLCCGASGIREARKVVVKYAIDQMREKIDEMQPVMTAMLYLMGMQEVGLGKYRQSEAK